MEVKSANDGLLTNIEVLELLLENRQKSAVTTSVAIELQNKQSIEIETSKYISESSVGKYSSEIVRTFLSKVKSLGFGLTEGEILQFANHIPTRPVEIHLV